MSTDLTREIKATLAEFPGANRLFDLIVDPSRCDTATPGLLVEAYAAEDTVLDIPVYELIVLSTNAHLIPDTLLGQPAALEITLPDGNRERMGGEIGNVAMLGSDGGLARYRIHIMPWIWRLAQVRNSRAWQDKTVVQIVDAVFAAYTPSARWRWSGDTAAFLAIVPARSYCCQYRESDLDFVRRILAEEGLGWRVEHTDDGPCLVLFADSTSLQAVPDDRSSRNGAGAPYHAATSIEHEDTVQALVEHRRLHASLTTLQSADYKSSRLIGAASPSFTRLDGLPELESFDVPGQYAFTNATHARRRADLQMEGAEARGQLWQGRSTIRTLRAGTRLTVTGLPLRRLGDAAQFTVSSAISVGVNNLPPPARLALAELFGPLPELLEQAIRVRPDELAAVIEQARQTGYANRFEAIPANLPWRPQLHRDDQRIKTRPTAHGAQTATVIGPDGNDRPNGADALYCDRLGRIRIRFHWQDHENPSQNASCWVRVAQRQAGGGMGSQFLPRIGQEVLVQFLENDIDRPVVVGALYNGRGEGGIAPTPGGRQDAESDLACFEKAHDHACSAQGNLAGGCSPAWHGASDSHAGHRNAAAQWGIRSAGFGDKGYNQLLFDDTDAQGRVQLRCTEAAAELNLGHLLHTADNFRGSLRGRGAELRSDAYGAVRAGAGLLISSYGIAHDARSRDAAGTDAAGNALLGHAVTTAGVLHAAAMAHLTVGLAAHAGAAKPGASLLNNNAAPLDALVSAASATVNDDTTAGGKLPHPDAPVIVVSAKDVVGVGAGQSLQLVNGETTSVMSMLDTQLLGGAGLRVQAGQAIGSLGAALKAGQGDAGLQLIAAKDAVDFQAQADMLAVQARDTIDVISANAHIDWAAAKRIVLSTSGGASLTIDGGNISVQCPGKITAHANKKSFTDPQQLGYPMPALPRSICVECLNRALAAGPAFTKVD